MLSFRWLAMAQVMKPGVCSVVYLPSHYVCFFKFYFIEAFWWVINASCFEFVCSGLLWYNLLMWLLDWIKKKNAFSGCHGDAFYAIAKWHITTNELTILIIMLVWVTILIFFYIKKRLLITQHFKIILWLLDYQKKSQAGCPPNLNNYFSLEQIWYVNFSWRLIKYPPIVVILIFPLLPFLILFSTRSSSSPAAVPCSTPPSPPSRDIVTWPQLLRLWKQDTPLSSPHHCRGPGIDLTISDKKPEGPADNRAVAAAMLEISVQLITLTEPFRT